MKPVLPLTFVLVTLVSLHSTLGIAAPICQYADSDSDNDGWGWENSQSCIVNGTSASQPVASSTATASNSSNHPVCNSRDSDQDGDGYGWENNQSCVVTVNTQSGAASVPEVAAATAGSGTSTDTTAENTTAANTSSTNSSDSQISNGLYQGRHPICSSRGADSDGDGWGYENNRSCKVVEGYVDPDAAAIVPPSGNSDSEKVGEIYRQNFNSANRGLYQADQLNSDWESPLWHLGFDQGRVKIVDAGASRGNAMEVTYPAGRYGAGGASAFLSDVQFGMGLPKSYEELYVSYDIKFAAGFDFVKGGKLPGLCGADTNAAPSTGCNTGGGYPTGYDGWSARGMWRENGELENYIYHASQRNYYGDDEFWNVSATPGVWHNVQHRVVMNTPGQKNGILEAWFDGTKVMSVNNLEFRKTESIGINLFYFSTFFGGNDASWAPATDQKMNFDNFVISTDKVN